MSIALRAHHLLCMLTYVGEGYNPCFVDNYNLIIERINQGETVHIVSGPDEICRPLTHDPQAHCFGQSITRRDRQAAQEISQVLGQLVSAESALKITPTVLQTLRAAFANRQVRGACQGCQWHSLCTRVAAGHYMDARLNLADRATTPILSRNFS